ncbi:hypothetical protein GCM10027578_21840 [Spirosoma luteolum]
MKTLNLRIQKFYFRAGRQVGSFTEYCPGLSVAETADRLTLEGLETKPNHLTQLTGDRSYLVNHTATGFTQIQVCACA